MTFVVREVFAISTIAALCVALVMPIVGIDVVKATDKGVVEVVASASSVPVGSSFTARVDTGPVAKFDSGQFDVVYDKSILRLDDIAAGDVGGVKVPVDMWSLENGRAVVNVPGITGVTGEGSLAVLHFTAISKGTTTIYLVNGYLNDVEANEISIGKWISNTVTVTEPEGGPKIGRVGRQLPVALTDGSRVSGAHTAVTMDGSKGEVYYEYKESWVKTALISPTTSFGAAQIGNKLKWTSLDCSLEFEYYDNLLKETLVLHRRSNVVYRIDTALGNELHMFGDGAIAVIDGGGKKLFEFMAPVAWDSKGMKIPVRYRLIEEKGYWTLNVAIDDKGASYPIYVDPTLKVDTLSAYRGETITGIVITGSGFNGTSNVTFGSGVNVTSYNADSDTQISCNITVDWDASIGGRNIGVTTGNVTSYLYDGLLIGVLDSEEIDNQGMSDPFMLHVGGDYYAVAYTASDGSGNISTFTVDTAGDISSVIDQYTFSDKASNPWMCHVNNTIYAIAYSGVSLPEHVYSDEAGWIETVSINATGHISQPTDTARNVEGLYHLNANNGTLVLDDTGNEHNGTCVNMEDGDWVVGKLNNCLTFDGVNEHVDLGDTYNYEYNEPFSVEFWMNTTAASGTLVSRKLSGGTGRGWAVGINLGNAYMELRRLSTNRIQVDTTGQTLGDGSWHHVVFTYDGSYSASGVTIYVDGSPSATSTTHDSLTGSIANTATMQFASLSNTDHFAGRLDEIVIYDEAISSLIVTSRYNGGAGVELSSSSAHFDDYRGTYPIICDVEGTDYYSIAYRGLTADVLSWSHLNSYSGDTAFAQAVGESDGTLMNMEDTDWVEGWGNLHNCLEFGGTDEYVDFGHRENMNFDRLDDYSAEFWMNTTSTTGSIILGQEETTGDLPGWNIQATNTGEVRSVLRHSSSNAITVTSTTGGTLNNGLWWYIVFTYDGSGNASGVNIYIDGVLDTNPTINADTLTSSPKSTVASYQYSGRNGTNVLYTGKLDEPTVYSRELTSAEISARFNSGPGTENITATDINVATVHIESNGATCGEACDHKVWDFNGVENFVSEVHMENSTYHGIAFQDNLNKGNLITVSVNTTGYISQTLGDSIEYAPVGVAGTVVAVNGTTDVYALAYRDGAGDGQIQTRTMNATSGDIGNSTIDTMEWAENHNYPSITYTSGSLYTIAAVDTTGGTDLGKAYTVNIDRDGTLDASALDSVTYENTEIFGRPFISDERHNVQTVVYSGPSDNGWVKTLEGAAFEIRSPQPNVTSTSPDHGDQGESNKTVIIYGSGFIGASNVTFGSNVTVNGYAVDDYSQITANITIDLDAPTGAHNVTVTSAGSTGTGVGAFEVIDNFAVDTISPSNGSRGEFVSNCSIVGKGFANVTSVDFGPLISTSNLTLVDEGNLTVDIDIAWNAVAGLRNVTVVSSVWGNETKVNGFNVTVPTPTVIECSPPTGYKSTVMNMTITGTWFADGVPDFGSNITVNSHIVSNSTSIDANITISGLATLGNRTVNVTSPGGTGSLVGGFEVLDAPSIVSVYPSWGDRGESDKNITITGSTLDSTTDVSFGPEVTVNGFTVGNTTTVYANITIPWDAVLGNYTVTVYVDGYTPVLVDGFEIRAPTPTLASVNPTSGERLDTLSVTLTGTGLIGANVTFSGNITTNSVTATNSTSIVANITLLANCTIGLHNVTVTTPGGNDTLVGAFDVIHEFDVVSIYPASGNRTQTLSVNITGHTFTSPNVTAVSFGADIAVNSFVISNSTLIIANITIGQYASGGLRDVTLTRVVDTTLASSFTVNQGAPQISSLDPVQGNTGDVLDVIIYGAGFTGTSNVSFGTGISVASFTVNSDIKITATIEISSGASTGTRDVTVTTGEGSGTFTDGFEVKEYSVASVLSNLGLMFLLLGLASLLTYFSWKMKFIPVSFAAGLTWFVLLVLLLMEPDIFNIGERSEWYYLLAFVFVLMVFSVLLLQMRTDIRFEANVKGRKMTWFEYGKIPFMDDPEGSAEKRQLEYRKRVRGRFNRHR